MDEAGNIRIIGRKKDMIVRGGENLNSNEINDFLEGFPGILDHAIIGMPDERLGERICAFLVPAPGHEDIRLEDVTAYLKERRTPKRFWPERLELIARIPHTGSGKVKKYLLKEELEKRQTAARSFPAAADPWSALSPPLPEKAALSPTRSSGVIMTTRCGSPGARDPRSALLSGST